MFPEPAYRIVLVQALAEHLLIDVNCSARRAAGWLQGPALRHGPVPAASPRPAALRPRGLPAPQPGHRKGPARPPSPPQGLAAPGERLLAAPGRQRGNKHRAGRRLPPPAPLPPFPPSFSRPHRTRPATCPDLRLSAAAGDGRRPRLRAEGGSSGAGRRRARRGLCGRQRGAPGSAAHSGHGLSLPLRGSLRVSPSSLPLSLPPCAFPCLPSCLLRAPESSHSSLLQARHVFKKNRVLVSHSPTS